jgi:hypothetical protein
MGNGMATVGITLAVAGLLASGLVHAAGNGSADAAPKSAKASHKIASKAGSTGSASAPIAPGPGRMQVEEPKAAAPVASARESKAWQKNHARGLTEAQKQAFRDRRDKMESMIAVIKAKRKAMASAKPEERAAIARELHNLMLEKDPAQANSASATARVAEPARDEASSSEDSKKSEAGEARRKQAERRLRQEQERNDELRKIQSEKLKAIENPGNQDNDD